MSSENEADDCGQEPEQVTSNRVSGGVFFDPVIQGRDITVHQTKVIPAAGIAETRLKQAVLEREARAWRQLLGRDSELINLGFTVRSTRGMPLPSQDDAPRNLEGLAAFYRQLKPRRMVVMGRSGAAQGVDAGTGKTVAVIKLLQDWAVGGDPGQPVLVRLSAGEWPGGDVDDWLVTHLYHVLGLRPSEAKDLVRRNLVIPVVDGLDEVDGTDAPGRGSRAAALLDQLNNRQLNAMSSPVVVTCRASHYKALTDADKQLRNAAVVRLSRVNPVEARNYLELRVGQRDANRRWERVLNAVHPDSPDSPASPALQSALDSPWRLTLATVVFQEPASDGTDYARDPDDLITRAETGTLSTYLLDNFVAAAVSTACHVEDAKATGVNREAKQAANRRTRLRSAGPDKVWRYLAELAAYLQSNVAAGDGRRLDGRTLSSTDLVLHELWPLAGTRLPRSVAMVMAILLIAPAPVTYTVQAASSADPMAPVTVILPLLALLLCLAMAYRWSAGWPAPHRINRSRLHALRPTRVLVGGALLALLGMWRPGFWSVMVLCVYLIYYRLLGGDHTPSSDPRSPLREDLRSWCALTVPLVALGIVPILLGHEDNSVDKTLIACQWLGLAILVSTLATSFAFATPLAAAARLTLVTASSAHSFWTRRMRSLVNGYEDRRERGMALGACLLYLALLLSTRSRLPWRLGTFLDDCYHLGLLRIAGEGWQFRHRELQEHLAAHARARVTTMT
ncbi:hypothetical protein ACFU96_43290 [Streptomyces sp. NPDC057620]|uniref:hypothetical protein n=1 Tax=Streptomyces sp. NPDC057620 TaxID=3346185 RepID=UPI0036AE275B